MARRHAAAQRSLLRHAAVVTAVLFAGVYLTLARPAIDGGTMGAVVRDPVSAVVGDSRSSASQYTPAR